MSIRPPDLAIIIVNYNTKDQLRDCLNSVIDDDIGSRVEVIVVDNNSRDGSAAMVTAFFPQVTLIRSPENLGFAKANNLAIRSTQKQYVLMLNPDTVLGSGALGKLVVFIDNHPEVGIVGCALRSADGKLQYSIGRFPTVGVEIMRSLFIMRLREFLWVKIKAQRTQAVDWVSGAIMLARRTALEEVGLFDDEFFLYGEEVDLCMRLQQAGWRIFYYPEADIIHYGGTVNTDPQLFKLLLKAKRQFFDKHNNRAKARLIMDVVMFSLYLRFAIWYVAARLTGRKNAWMRWRLYQQVLAATREASS